MKEFKNLLSFANLIFEKLANYDIVNTSKLYGSAKTFFLSELSQKYNQILCAIDDEEERLEIAAELNLWNCPVRIILFDKFSSEEAQEKLSLILSLEKFIILTNSDIFNARFWKNQNLKSQITSIKVGENAGYENIIDYLLAIGYTQTRYVEKPGDYATRGSIVDFWSYSESSPCRLEFDGDFIESMRYFDPISQRSIEMIEKANISPKLEMSHEATCDIFDYLSNPVVIISNDMNKFENSSDMNLPAEDKKILFDIEGDFSEKGLKINKFNSKEDSLVEYYKFDPFIAAKEKKARFVIEKVVSLSDDMLDLNLKPMPLINSNFELLFKNLNYFCETYRSVYYAVENDFQYQRISDLFEEFDEKTKKYFDEGKIKLKNFPLRKGFINENSKEAIFSNYEVFNKPFRRKLSSKQKQSYKRSELKGIKKGDYVVHENYGIGKFDGLEKIKIGDIEQECIKLLYAEGGAVYVNIHYLNLVKKYEAKDGSEPKLSVLGSGEWNKTKLKIKKRIKEVAKELIELYAKRKLSKGYAFSPNTVMMRELEASFLYEDTPDQRKAYEETMMDMESDKPMDRLICGDVGFGKTEIAVRAAFKAALDGKQTVVLAPTTILVDQHYNTFIDRLKQFPVKVESISRFKSLKEQKEVLKDLENGKIDIIIGTHRLLSKDVKFKDLGLIIIDEEHRFGVAAKEKLRMLKPNVDTLSLTATPIPRTLNMALLGSRDLSIIATPPPNRIPIITKVDTFNIFKIRSWILFEIKRGGQVFFIHDRVQSIEKIADYLKKYLPEAKIAVAHGQMSPHKLEKTIQMFANREIDVLVSTKIIESGIDLPNANTIIINRADRFGMAELHQLRGRVGRSSTQAYAYFVIPPIDSIAKKALKRLEAIEDYSDLGAGFSLSMRDLEMRGAGNLLGEDQTGFFEEIGFDMYMKLLEEAVDELKKDEFKEIFKDYKKPLKTDAKIDMFFQIAIPSSYIPDQNDRLTFYSSLFNIQNLSEIEDIKNEMIDKYGKMPQQIERLIKAAILKFTASYALFDKIIIHLDKSIFHFSENQDDRYYNQILPSLLTYLFKEFSSSIEVKQDKEKIKIIFKNKSKIPEVILGDLINFCEKAANFIGQSDKLTTNKEETVIAG